MTRALQRSQAQISRQSPPEQIRKESSEDVEKDEGGEDGNDGENGVGFGDLRLLFELVELRVLGKLCAVEVREGERDR